MNADVETISVQLIDTQKHTAALMITRVQEGDIYRRQILLLVHQNFQKSNYGGTARGNGLLMTEEVLLRLN